MSPRLSSGPAGGPGRAVHQRALRLTGHQHRGGPGQPLGGCSHLHRHDEPGGARRPDPAAQGEEPVWGRIPPGRLGSDRGFPTSGSRTISGSRGPKKYKIYQYIKSKLVIYQFYQFLWSLTKSLTVVFLFSSPPLLSTKPYSGPGKTLNFILEKCLKCISTKEWQPCK